MSNETMVTQRKAILQHRAAFARGWLRNASLDDACAFDVKAIQAVADRTFPLPKVTRPRRAVHGGFRFEVRGGVVVQQDANGGDVDNWYAAFGDDDKGCKVGDGFIPVTPELLRDIASLIENPTEEVEADA